MQDGALKEESHFNDSSVSDDLGLCQWDLLHHFDRILAI